MTRLFVVLLTLLSVAGAYAEPPTQERMVQILRSTGTPEDVKAAVLREVKKIPVAKRETVLFHFLQEEAARYQRYFDQGYLAAREGAKEGPAIKESDPLETYAEIMSMLGQHHDPAVIPLLVGYSHISVGAREQAADFGEDALEEVIAVVNTEENKAGPALNIIEMMYDRKSVRRPLSAAAQRRIAALVESKLNGRQPAHIAMAAIRVAAKTRDSKLLARVKQLALEARAAWEIGADADEVEQLRREAIEALREAEQK